nr:MAG TPA: Nucleotide modification associated domain 1 [Caudoviricetes sp.]
MQEKIEIECEKVAKLLKEKNKKYGNSFKKTVDEFGYACIVIRLFDKLNRIKTLLIDKEKDDMEDESIEDTLTDLAGYAILSKIYLNEKTSINNEI